MWAPWDAARSSGHAVGSLLTGVWVAVAVAVHTSAVGLRVGWARGARSAPHPVLLRWAVAPIVLLSAALEQSSGGISRITERHQRFARRVDGLCRS